MNAPRSSLLVSCGFAGLLLAAGCGSDSNLRDQARCDGELNSVEQTVDDAFDDDGDGYFDSSSADCRETYDPSQLDCNDNNSEVNPGEQEIDCNDRDDDCDEATPDAADSDADGSTVCDGDCDDNSAAVAPGLDEVLCDFLDNDCDPATPDGDDLDADGWNECEDCDDENIDVNPDTAEVVCNGLDDDCNEATPDGDDFDNDGFEHCFDCDDNDPLAYPGAEEICEDGIDQDCDTLDASCAPPTWDGTWDTTTVYYECAFSSVVIDFNSMSVLDLSPTISFSAIGGTQPGTMTGSLGAGDSFNVSISIAGQCTETYQLTGNFTNSDLFTATLTATFVESSAFQCLDCSNQSWPIQGVRQ